MVSGFAKPVRCRAFGSLFCALGSVSFAQYFGYATRRKISLGEILVKVKVLHMTGVSVCPVLRGCKRLMQNVWGSAGLIIHRQLFGSFRSTLHGWLIYLCLCYIPSVRHGGSGVCFLHASGRCRRIYRPSTSLSMTGPTRWRPHSCWTHLEPTA